jgi:hypothetical protein
MQNYKISIQTINHSSSECFNIVGDDEYLNTLLYQIRSENMIVMTIENTNIFVVTKHITCVVSEPITETLREGNID